MNEGERARDFKLRDKDGQEYSLKSFDSKYLIIYFYPKDNTEGCSIEAKEFNNYLNDFRRLGAKVVGISGGDQKTKKKFCESLDLSIVLLSDSDFLVSQKYGAYGEKQFMGKKFMGILRTTFILNRDKKVIKIYENVKPSGHAKEVLDFIKNKNAQ